MSDLRIGGVPIAELKVAELKAELEARELSKTGKKDELVARLISFMEVHIGLKCTQITLARSVSCYQALSSQIACQGVENVLSGQFLTQTINDH